MTVEVQMVNAPEEFVSRGGVDVEKAELLREVRGELLGAGRLEANKESSLLYPCCCFCSLPTQQRSEFFVLLVLALWFFVGIVMWLQVVRLWL